MQTECFVCRKHRGDVQTPGGAIYEDGYVYVGHLGFPDGRSTYLGYLMIETQRHIPGLADLSEAEAAVLGQTVARVSRALKSVLHAEHVYSFVIGDQVPHLHVHLVPRYPGAPKEYWGVHVDEWPGAPHGGRLEIEAVCARLRAALEPSKR